MQPALGPLPAARPPSLLVDTLRALRRYHRHRVFGEAATLDVAGPLLFVGNHSLATYDTLLLGLEGYEATGRWFHGLGDRMLFRTRATRTLASRVGFVEGSQRSAVDVLRRGGLLGVLPGGMREALRSRRDRYRVDWRGRYGFVRLSILSGAPIVLSACPRADDLFDVRPSRVTDWAYGRFKVPLPLARGLGPTLVPRRIALDHLLSEPIPPPVGPDALDDDVVRAHHAALTARMERLLRDALALDRERRATLRFVLGARPS